MPARIRHIPLAEWWDPARAFASLYRDSAYSFWLDAGPDATSGFSYLGAASERSRFLTASVPLGTITVSVPGDPGQLARTSPTTVFDYLGDDLAHAVENGANGDGFRLGWVGWLGYELGAQTVETPVHDSRYPDAALLHIDRALVFDHASRVVSLIALEENDEPSNHVDEWASEVVDVLRAASAHARLGAVTETPHRTDAVWRHDETSYVDLIRRCQSSIRDGDAYQLCLTNEVRIDTHPHPVDAYLAVRAGSPSHHGGLLRFGDTALLSASPEQFLSVSSDGAVRTRPIKGTRPRSTDAAADAALRAELESSEKERAENLMIVDLMRNDLGRVSQLGSVVVSSLLAVESYAHVHQLVSTVESQLAVGLTGIDAVRSCFPAGSMTGAPKISAMSILNSLEGGPRGIYSGAFGYFGLDGAVDLAMVIRSIVLDPGGASVGTGGGITALSDPHEEVEETRIKAAALLAALGAE